jgi:hypothetical protein
MVARVQRSVDTPSFHEWTLPDGGLWATFHRRGGYYLVRFPGLADFEIAADGGSATCWPVPGLDAPTREHLYLNQVLPLALSRRGKLTFHASAVEFGDGAAAFLASAGRGKSTLCAAFAVRGHRFLTDDNLILEREQEDFLVAPSHPSIRLWQDSEQHLLASGSEKALPVKYSSKARLLACSQLRYCDEVRPLVAAYVLGDGSSAEIELHRLTESEAVIEWTKHSFLLDIEDEATLAAHFDRLAILANRVPCYYLDYPRDFNNLPTLLRKITAWQQRSEIK